MKTTIGILLLLIPFLIFFIPICKILGFWQTVAMILFAILMTVMIGTGVFLLGGK